MRQPHRNETPWAKDDAREADREGGKITSRRSPRMDETASPGLCKSVRTHSIMSRSTNFQSPRRGCVLQKAAYSYSTTYFFLDVVLVGFMISFCFRYSTLRRLNIIISIIVSNDIMNENVWIIKNI